MAKKEKFTMYLDQEMVEWLDLNTEDELTKSGLIRNLIRTAMKRKSRNKSISKHLDPFATSVITPDVIPDDLSWSMCVASAAEGGSFQIFAEKDNGGADDIMCLNRNGSIREAGEC